MVVFQTTDRFSYTLLCSCMQSLCLVEWWITMIVTLELDIELVVFRIRTGGQESWPIDHPHLSIDVQSRRY